MSNSCRMMSPAYPSDARSAFNRQSRIDDSNFPVVAISVNDETRCLYCEFADIVYVVDVLAAHVNAYVPLIVANS